MKYNISDFINNPKLQIQENELLKFFQKDQSLTIFDIGACEGLNSIRYSRLFPNSTIYAFEALSANYQLIKDNLEKYNFKNIKPFKLCLSNKIGISEFHISSGHPEKYPRNIDWDFGNKSSSLLSPYKTKETHPWLKFDEIININTETLNNFCSQNNITQIDFIHMDAQGAELMVLEGATNLLENINLIWLEVEKIPLYKDQPLKNDIERFMKSYNFVKIKDQVGRICGDQLWMAKHFLKSNQL